MPYKSEKIIIEGTKYDRRKRLSEEEKDKIRALKGTVSIHKIAETYGVSRRTIQFILYPERLVKNIQLRQERGGSIIYYDREKHKEYIKGHRRYKQDLYMEGKI